MIRPQAMSYYFGLCCSSQFPEISHVKKMIFPIKKSSLPPVTSLSNMMGGVWYDDTR